jgi:hypothetical protein
MLFIVETPASELGAVMAFKIFVSHVWRAQHDYYWGLLRLLDRARRFEFIDLSVPKLRPLDGTYDGARSDILKFLRTADAVLTINEWKLSKSQAVQDELAEAEKCGIPIIAVSPPSRRGKVRSADLDIIGRARKAHWTGKSIIDAIRDEVKKSRKKTKSAANPAYEPIGQIVIAAPFSSDQLSKVVGDDEIESAEQEVAPEERAELAQSIPPTAEFPRDVLGGGKPALVVPTERWFGRMFSWARR